MSLKSRLRGAIIGLVVTVVITLSVLYLRTLADSIFADIGQRAAMVSTETAALVELLVRERAAAIPAAGDFEETKRRWAAIVREDPILPRMLQKMMQNPKAILDIEVLDSGGTILCAVAARPGEQRRVLSDYTEWEKKPFYQRLWDVWAESREYSLILPLGTPLRDSRPVFVIQVIVSSVLIRNMLAAPLLDLALVLAFSLAGSIALAVIVTRVVSRPLERMLAQIDRISAGGNAAPAAPGAKAAPGNRAAHPSSSPFRLEAREFAIMESKLAALGQQYRGYQADVSQLKTNLEWMMQRLEQAVILTDAMGRLTLVGPAAERMLGKARAGVIGGGVDSLFPAESAAGMVIARALERREQVRDLPVSIERLGEPPFRALLNVEPLTNLDSGQLLGAMITLRDSEGRRQIESEIDVASRLAAINRVTGGVAHEIKNPLNAIALHLELLRSRIRESGEEREDLENEVRIIAREITRLDRVVKTFLDFTRPVELKLQVVDLSLVAREVVSLVQPQAALRGVTLEYDGVAEGAARISGDRDMLLQALLNVVNNAVEAMDKPGKVCVSVSAASEREWVLRVSDEGCGISPDTKGKIFNLYYTTKEKGSGIGLAMTFRVVQLHHGRIDLASQVGRGTTFEMIFPAARANAAAGPPSVAVAVNQSAGQA